MTGNELPILVYHFFWQTHPTHDLLEHSTHAVMFASKEGTVSMQSRFTHTKQEMSLETRSILDGSLILWSFGMGLSTNQPRIHFFAGYLRLAMELWRNGDGLKHAKTYDSYDT